MYIAALDASFCLLLIIPVHLCAEGMHTHTRCEFVFCFHTLCNNFSCQVFLLKHVHNYGNCDFILLSTFQSCINHIILTVHRYSGNPPSLIAGSHFILTIYWHVNQKQLGCLHYKAYLVLPIDPLSIVCSVGSVISFVTGFKNQFHCCSHLYLLYGFFNMYFAFSTSLQQFFCRSILLKHVHNYGYCVFILLSTPFNLFKINALFTGTVETPPP